MKKLLLLSLISFTPITKPVSAPRPLCYSMIAAGTTGMFYTGYHAGSLVLKIRKLNAQLQNKALHPTMRAQLQKELQTTYALLKNIAMDFLVQS
jgi:hypothetical protein